MCWILFVALAYIKILLEGSWTPVYVEVKSTTHVSKENNDDYKCILCPAKIM
jgi:hypothetical protein